MLNEKLVPTVRTGFTCIWSIVSATAAGMIPQLPPSFKLRKKAIAAVLPRYSKWLRCALCLGQTSTLCLSMEVGQGPVQQLHRMSKVFSVPLNVSRPETNPGHKLAAEEVELKVKDSR